MPKISKYYWALILAGIISGTVVLGGKLLSNAGLSLYQISVLPAVLVTIFFLPLIVFNKDYRLKKGTFSTILLFGIIVSLLTLAQFGSVILGAPVAIAVLLLYTQPLWTVLFSKLILKEKLNKNSILACIIVILGMVILINPFALEQISSWPGILIALVGGILLSGWVVVGSFASKKLIQPISLIFHSRLVMLLILALSYPIIWQISHDPKLISSPFSLNPSLIIWLIVFALVSSIFNNIFYLYGVKKVATVDAGIIMLLEPVSAAILAAIVLHQTITLPIVIGGVLILVANYLVISKSENYGQISAD